MPDQLNVIALISGGKDSLYSLLHCMQHGHQVIALANLHPAQSENATHEAEDINSFMYQTVGHSVIPLYAKALGIPLYRRPLTGTAMVTDKYYSYKTNPDAYLDETENLTALLHEIIKLHPSANAISTGAIQSTYQRVRVESVALRLGLTPIGFLWQYPVLPPPPSRSDSTTGLLEDMAASGCDARIIKIASGGIAEKLLWTNVTSTKTMQGLVKGLSMFFDNDELGLRGAVVGEGGEFESLALSGPRSVWKHGYIEVDVDPAKSWSEDGGTSYVKLERARLVQHIDKKEAEPAQHTQGLVPIPALLDPMFETISQNMSHQPNPSIQSLQMTSHRAGTVESVESNPKMAGWSYIVSERTVQVNNLSYNAISGVENGGTQISLVDQVEAIVSYVPTLLDRISSQISSPFPLSTSSIIHTVIVLRDISSFTVVNQVYASLFKDGVPNPPARVTIAALLPEHTGISLSLIIDLGLLTEKEGLHVQSRSYWAPANIGPYSQAISVPVTRLIDRGEHLQTVRTVHIAGQIPLIPVSMSLSSATFSEQAILSLQHLWRLGQERRIDMWAFGVAYLGRECVNTDLKTSSRYNVTQRAVISARIWRSAHLGARKQTTTNHSENNTDSEDEIDIWHLRQNYSEMYAMSAKKRQLLHQLPMQYKNSEVTLPAFLVAEVSALPRQAAIEWWSLGIAGFASPMVAKSNHVVRMETKNSTVCTLSVLTIKLDPETPSRQVSYVAYLIKAAHGHEEEGVHTESRMGTTLSELIEHVETVDQDGHLVNGYAFVKSSAWKIWENFTTIDQPTSPDDGFKGPTLRDSKLGDSVTMIPCHELWGHAGLSISSTEETRTTTWEAQIEPLDVAFLLRVDSKS